MSFLASYGTFTPQNFEDTFVPALIAPYWADAYTFHTGIVWYRESTSQADKNRAQSEIRAIFREATRFTPTLVFIATWDHIGYCCSGRTDKVLIGGASAASEATLSSCPLRFAVYVGLVYTCNQSLRR